MLLPIFAIPITVEQKTNTHEAHNSNSSRQINFNGSAGKYKHSSKINLQV